MSNVQISAQNHRLSTVLLQFLQVSLKIDVPLFNSIRQSVQPLHTWVWHVCHDQDKRVKVYCDGTTFSVVLPALTEVILYGNRLGKGWTDQDCRSWVSFLVFWTIPELSLLRKILFQSFLNPFIVESEFVDFGLVQAEYLWAGTLEERIEGSTFHGGSDAVYVPAPYVNVGLFFGFFEWSFFFHRCSNFYFLRRCNFNRGRHFLGEKVESLLSAFEITLAVGGLWHLLFLRRIYKN